MLMGNCIGGDSGIDIATSINTTRINTSWLGIPFDQLEPEHFEQILWELHEVNFQYEFRALDQRAHYRTPYSDDPHTENLLAACFPDSSFSFPTLHTANHHDGIVSSLHQEQAHYLFAMACVMSCWRGTENSVWAAKTSHLRWTVDQLCVLEKEIVQLYCQAFYNCFQCAPITPHCLSPAAVAKNPLVG